MRVSTDHGQTWISNEVGHSSPGDDRPWLAYSAKDQSLYVVYDGLDALHVARASLAAGPLGGIAFVQDVPAVPECLIGGQFLVRNNKDKLKLANPCYAGAPVTIRQCVCPPGGIAVDPTTGSVYITYSRQNGAAGGGVGVARSDDLGLTWSYFSIPGTGSTGSAFDTEWNFAPVKVDTQGNVYVTWGELRNESVQIRFAVSRDHAQTWSKPGTVSTTSDTNVFPTMDLVAPGSVDIAYYGTTTPGDPNAVNAVWNVYVARGTDALSSGSPTFTPRVAVAGIHTGAIESSNETSDRSLLDFFQLVVDASGKANIIYTAGQQGPADPTTGLSSRLTNLFFVKEL
jgi:hypothetical protein